MLALVLAAAAAAAAPRSVLVVGGSGRVGGSTVRWLHELSRREGLDLRLTIGGRSASSFVSAQVRLSRAGVPASDVDYVPLDVGAQSDALRPLVRGRALVAHTAGPFQGRRQPGLLEACVAEGVPYVDCCDEWELARESKALLHEAAGRAGVPAVTAAGIWPGASALMAAEAVARLGGSAERLDLSFFTAGTGNAGPTIVSATFLLLCQQALTYEGGAPVGREAWTDRRDVDFGPKVGVRSGWLLDNPDVPTCAAALNVPAVSSRFGTAPMAWNYLFGAMKSIPRSLLGNRELMQRLALFSEPIIRAVDALVGATNAMRVDATGAGGRRVTLRVVHADLESCVGLATAAFALELLRGGITPGVWFPAELPPAARARILEYVREDAIVWEM